MKLVDITPANILTRPKWEDVSRAKVGDILVNNRRNVGVVYKKEPYSINVCYVNRWGVMYLQNFYRDAKLMHSEDSVQIIALTSVRAAGDRSVVSDDEFAAAQKIYSSVFRIKEVAGK